MNGIGSAKPRSDEEKGPVKIIIFTTCPGMCFSHTYLDEHIVVITYSHEYLHTQVTSFALTPELFSSIYFQMTRLNADFPLLKHLEHFLPEFSFLPSDLVLYSCAQTLWHLCAALCLEFREAGERRWPQSWGERQEEWQPARVEFCLPELFLYFLCSFSIETVRLQTQCDRLSPSILPLPWWRCVALLLAVPLVWQTYSEKRGEVRFGRRRGGGSGVPRAEVSKQPLMGHQTLLEEAPPRRFG